MPDVRQAVANPARAHATALADSPGISQADPARARLMQTALRTLLDRVRGAREVLPHLAALETALGRQGVAAIVRMSPQWLPKMYSQLSSLPIGAQEPLLLDLQRQLFEALQARAAPVTSQAVTANKAVVTSAPAESVGSPRAAPREFLSTFDTDSRMMVSDASHTDFMREIDAAQNPG